MKFSTLRQANIARLPTFKNSLGQPAHSKHDGSEWSLDDWLLAVGGEVGEALNKLKKVRRGDFTLDDMRGEIGKELADIVIYLDILAYRVSPNRNFAGYLVSFSDLSTLEYVVADDTTIAKLGNKLLKGCGHLAHQIDNGCISIVDCKGMLLHVNWLACRLGINLGDAVRDKFNEVSERIGSPVCIS